MSARSARSHPVESLTPPLSSTHEQAALEAELGPEPAPSFDLEALATSDCLGTDDTLVLLLPELTGYFYRRLGNVDDAADAAAETLLILVGKGDKLPVETESTRQYAFGVARKVLAKTLKGRVKRSELAEHLSSDLQPVALPPADPNLPLERALGKLPDRDRELILLVAWEGLGVAQAGAVLGLRPDAARKRYSRIRASLRSELDASN